MHAKTPKHRFLPHRTATASLRTQTPLRHQRHHLHPQRRVPPLLRLSTVLPLVLLKTRKAILSSRPVRRRQTRISPIEHQLQQNAPSSRQPLPLRHQQRHPQTMRPTHLLQRRYHCRQLQKRIPRTKELPKRLPLQLLRWRLRQTGQVHRFSRLPLP